MLYGRMCTYKDDAPTPQLWTEMMWLYYSCRIFPRPDFATDDPTAMLSPHLDMVPMELNGALYLDEVGERSGAFVRRQVIDSP